MMAMPKEVPLYVIAGTEHRPSVTDHSTLVEPSPHVDVKAVGEVSRISSDGEYLFRAIAGLTDWHTKLATAGKPMTAASRIEDVVVPATVRAARGKLDDRLDQIEARIDRQSEAVLSALKNHTTGPKSEAPPQVETAHNRPMTDVTRAELDAKFELLDTKLGARIQQAVDAMQARDEVHKHALEKMQAEVTSRDAVFAEIAKRQDLSTEKFKSEMAGRDAVYAEIAKRQELAAEKFREEMAGRDAVAAERARAHELTVQKALAETAGREALMDQRLKSMDGELAKIGDSFKSVKANIWLGVATTASIVAAIVAVALAGFDSGRETSKAIAESTVKLEQLIKAQEAKAAAPATPSAATPAPVATPEAPAAK